MPLTQSDPRLTMWSKSPSMAMSLPSRTAAIMPHPHEQKLHEVVYSLTLESFRVLFAALTSPMFNRLATPSPAPPPIAPLSHALRLRIFKEFLAESFPTCLPSSASSPERPGPFIVEPQL